MKDRIAFAMGCLYRFGPFEIDPQRRTLSCNVLTVPLTPKAFDVLLFLAQNPNRLITKEELLQAVWGDTFVEEGNLKQYISHLRKALADNSENAQLIVTIARKGYQFTGDVAVAEAADAPKQVAVQVPAPPARRHLLAWMAAATLVLIAASGFWIYSRFSGKVAFSAADTVIL